MFAYLRGSIPERFGVVAFDSGIAGAVSIEENTGESRALQLGGDGAGISTMGEVVRNRPLGAGTVSNAGSWRSPSVNLLTIFAQGESLSVKPLGRGVVWLERGHA